VAEQFPGVRLIKGGEAKDWEETRASLFGGVIFVMLVIYALMAVPFRSYLQPLIIMCVIPFGLSGAILGHLLTFQPLSILSMLGVIALTGVVVNDSLVLVDRINRLRVEAPGMRMSDVLLAAGKSRFRPIILTSLTTFAGLIPILLERSLQAQFLIPMATSLGFGVLFATFVTLLMVPCAYAILEDLSGLAKRSIQRSE
jgi:multidrug efflux pump subunit AcrB